MKDIDIDCDLTATLDVWKDARTERLEETLHRDFCAMGMEAGLYIHADKETYLRFARQMATQPPTGSEIDWIEAKGRVAAACLRENGPETRRTTILSLMRSDIGWRVVTATFSVEERATPTVARRVPLQ